MTEATIATGAVPRSATRSSARGRAGGAWPRRAMVAPTVLATVVLGAYPLVFILLTAFSQSSLGRPLQAWVGTANFAEVLSDGDVTASLVRNVGYAIVVSALSVVLGVVTALALRAATTRGSIVRTLLLLPLITPPVIVGAVWKLIFNPSGGLLGTVLSALGRQGEPVAVLSSPASALVGIGVADVWEWTPLIALLVFAALLGQDRSVAEAAALDGAHGRTCPGEEAIIGARERIFRRLAREAPTAAAMEWFRARLAW